MQETVIRITSDLLTPSNSSDFEGVLSHATFKYAGSTFETTEPVSWNVHIVNGGEGFLYIEGEAKSRLKTQCVRCLEDANVKLTSVIEGYVKIKDTAKLPEDVGEDECVELKDGKYIDIFPLLQGAIMLDLPMQPLCDENCKGLFEYCDNHGECSDDEKQSPFEVLKNYKF